MKVIDDDLVTLRDRVVGGELSAVDVTEAYLTHIQQSDSQYRAFVSVMGEAAIQQARDLDQKQARDPEFCGPLHGVPIALKDLLATNGVATTCGMRVLRNWVPDYDAGVVERLRAAGAVIIGKTKLTDGAFSAHHPDVAHPQNPWCIDVWPGVSSSGSGVAVAARMAAGAIGTDTGGSIRFPSAACGLVGIKPTYGRVTRHGVFPLAPSLDHIGPMARCVGDAARMLTVLAGFDQRDPTSIRAAAPNFEVAQLDIGGRLRVGYDAYYAETGVTPELVGRVRQTIDRLANDGVEIIEVKCPPRSLLVEQWVITAGTEGALAHADFFPQNRADYGPELAWLLDLGLKASALEYARIERARELYRSEVEALFASYELDALLLPAMRSAPPTWAESDQMAVDDEDTAPFIAFVAPWNYSGHPSVSVPVGLNEDGIPLAVQTIAALGCEHAAIRAAARIEALVGRLPAPLDMNSGKDEIRRRQ